jgi:hypothetical protein
MIIRSSIEDHKVTNLPNGVFKSGQRQVPLDHVLTDSVRLQPMRETSNDQRPDGVTDVQVEPGAAKDVILGSD